MSKVQKAVVLAAGAGAAFCLCALNGQRRRRSAPENTPLNSSDESLTSEIFLDRLALLESRLDQAETGDAAIAALDRRLREQREELDTVRARLTETEQRLETEQRIDLIERSVAGHSALIDELRIQAENYGAHVQRLVNVIEKLLTQPAERANNNSNQFQSLLDEAMKREPR